MNRRGSNLALALLLLVVVATTAGEFFVVAQPFGALGFTTEWSSARTGRALTIVAVAAGSAADRAGLTAGDRIAGFASFTDRVAVNLQSALPDGPLLRAGQPVAFSIERGAAVMPIALRASPQYLQPMWFFELRLAIYLIGVLIVGALVAARPSRITWGFALFVIFGLWPDRWTLLATAVVASPTVFLAVLFVDPFLFAAGFLGLVTFATRFPEGAVHPPYFRTVERGVQIFLAVLVGLIVECSIGMLYGWPSFEYGALNTTLDVTATLVAIGLLVRTLAHSRGNDRVRLTWAVLGPSLGMLLFGLDEWLSFTPLPLVYAASAGLLSGIVPFSMMYAILRHRVIDIGFTLNRTLAEAVSRSDGGPSLDELPIARRALVRRTALLLSADIPLVELYGRLATLLASFVDASSILIAVGNASSARLEYFYEDGVGGRPDKVQLAPDGTTARVLRDGKSRLYRRATDWPSDHRISLGGRVTRDSESAIFVPVSFGGETIGVLSVQSRRVEAYDGEELALLKTCALYLGARIYDDERYQSAGAASAPGQDRLTRLADGQAFDEALEREWKRCLQSSSPLSLLAIEVDRFPIFNELYGHVAGDTCLRQLAQAVVTCVKRPRSFVARCGGAEFAALLPECEAAEAIAAGEAICAAVRALDIPHQGSSLGNVTVSVGLGSITPNPGTDSRSIVAAAYTRLQRAKDQGRNRLAADKYVSDAMPAQARVVARHNLPPVRSSFVGREADVAQITTLLAANRLVTVVGPSGIGKTRVALEVARRAFPHYADGVWFIDLSAIACPDAVPQVIANVLFPELDEAAAIPRLVEMMQAKRLLMVLDNCESVAEACTALLVPALNGAPDVAVLAASERPLQIASEICHRLAGLSLSEGATLFTERARRKSNENAADIAERVQGVPLSIELAAAGASGESFEDPPRELSLQLERCYESLSIEEQTLFRRLAVFAGGWTSDAAIDVCAGETAPSANVERGLETLLAKGLLVQTDRDRERFKSHEAVRAFAASVLRRCGEDQAIALVHARYFARYARERLTFKSETSRRDWQRMQLVDLQNYCAALRVTLATPRHYSLAVDVLRCLQGSLLETQPFEKLDDSIRAALASEDVPEPIQAAMLVALAELVRFTQPADSIHAAQRAMKLFYRLGEDLQAAQATCLLANVQLRSQSGFDASLETLLERAQSSARVWSDRSLSVELLRNLAYVRSENGKYDGARAALREAGETIDRSDVTTLAELLASSAREEFRANSIAEAVRLWRQAASLVEESRPAFASLCRLNSGLGELLLDNATSARALFHEGFAGLRQAQHPFGIAQAFDCFAQLARRNGDPARAVRIAGFAQARFERGLRRESIGQRLFDELLDDLRRRIGQDRFDDEWSRGRVLSLTDAANEAASV